MLPRSLIFANGKGGVGKTSLSSHVAGLAAEAGYKTLLVDLDVQANVGRDLGYFGRDDVDDRGQSLLEAIQFGRAVTPVRDIRPGLDVVPGGAFIDDVVKLAPNFKNRGRDPRLVLDEALAPLADQYHLVVIDSPPGDRYLQEIALCTAQFVVIPTRSDEASLDGLSRTGAAFAEARQVNPQLELLGVVLFGIGASATVIQAQVRRKIAEGLGSVAPVFDAQVRYLEAPAVEARNRGMLVHEYERDLVANAPKWYERRRAKSGKHRAEPAPAVPAAVERVATTAHKLAGDYASLTTQILTDISARTQPQAPRAAAGGTR